MNKIITQEDINRIDAVCKKYNITNYTINSDGSIDVDGDVNLYGENLYELPLKFGTVTSSFHCNVNSLTSLEGSPTSVGGGFDCGYNYLTSLKGCPTSVGGYFDCTSNELTSLKFSPIKVGNYFVCDNNDLPDHFMDLYNKLSDEEFKIFIKYQDDLRIWEDVYKEEAAHDLFDDIKDGMR